jgi:acetate kinase
MYSIAMQSFGIRLDNHRNLAATGGRADIISAAGSQVKVFVLSTDEERCIAEQVTMFIALAVRMVMVLAANLRIRI